MQIVLASIRPGRSHSTELEELTRRYLVRVGGSWQTELRAFRSEDALMEWAGSERRKIRLAIWLLDSKGRQLSSENLALQMESLRSSGYRRLVAAIGPADGWSESARKLQGAGDMLLSLGPMTLPHELARVVLAEQLYRATTILAGHPYHLGHE